MAQHGYNKDVRAKQLGQSRPKTIWLTGLSGSGKSTIVNELRKDYLFTVKRQWYLTGTMSGWD